MNDTGLTPEREAAELVDAALACHSDIADMEHDLMDGDDEEYADRICRLHAAVEAVRRKMKEGE